MSLNIRKTLGKILTWVDSIKYDYQYLTDEVWTGKYWIDGKKIYRRCFIDTPSAATTGNRNVTLGTINNIEHLINCGAILTRSNGYKITAPYIAYSALTYAVTIYVNGDNVAAYEHGSSISLGAVPQYIIFEYTKTTD